MNFIRNAAGSVKNSVSNMMGRGDADDSMESAAKEDEPLPVPPESVKPGFSLNKYGEKHTGDAAVCGTWVPKPTMAFDLRVGPNYASTKKKAPSGPPFTELVGVDLVRSDKRIDNIGQYLDFPSEWTDEKYALGGSDGPTLFVVNVQIPTDSLEGGITSFFDNTTDGVGVSIVFYFRMKEELAASLREESSVDVSPAGQLFADFCEEAHDEDFASAWKGRFKVILAIKDIEEYRLPGFISSYNAKPVLIRTTGQVHRGKNYVEQDINCHAFGAVARKALGVLMDKFHTMSFDVGYVIESRGDDEMPETLLGSGSFNEPNKDLAPHWSTFLQQQDAEEGAPS